MDYRALDEALEYLNGKDTTNRYIYESLQDEFNLDLLLAEAEQYIVSSLSDVFLESESIRVLNEGVRETIMNYVQKIVQGIQKAWNKFTYAFSQAQLKFIKEKVKPLIDKTDNIDFTINNYKTYDFTKLDSIQIQPFDYDRMKDDLQDSQSYFKAQYSQLDISGSHNIKEALEKYLDKKIIPKFQCKQEQLQNISNFMIEDYFKYRDAIEKDIESLNNSNENIKNIVNQVVETEVKSSENVKSENVYFNIDNSLDIYLEDGEKEPGMSFEDNSGEVTNGDDKNIDDSEKREKSKEVTKAVRTYMTCNTKLLSAKMSIVNKQKREAFLILNHFYGSKKINDTAVTAKNKGKEAASNIVAKVDTSLKKKK